MNLRPAVALALCALLATTGCGMAKSAAAPASAARTAPPSSPAHGYATYASATGKYSLEYPAAWYDAGPELLDGQYVAKSFSSQDIPNPILLSNDGVWLTVSLDTKPRACLSGPGPVTSAKRIQVSIDGVSGAAYISLGADPYFQGGDGLTGINGPSVPHGGWCYRFTFLTTTYANTNLRMAEIEHIYSSFRFNR